MNTTVRRYKTFTLSRLSDTRAGTRLAVLAAPVAAAGGYNPITSGCPVPAGGTSAPGLTDLGTFRIGNTARTNPFAAPSYYVWFDFTNARLYESPLAARAQAQLAGIAQHLGLEFLKITYLELAADTPTNYLPRIASALVDPGLRVFTLGKAPDTATQEYRGLNWESWQSQVAVTNTALRIKNREKTYELYCYDKAREIGVSGKTYISRSDGFGTAPLWRYEIRLHSDAIDEYIAKVCTAPQPPFPSGLVSPEAAQSLYYYFAQRLIRAKAYRGTTLSRSALQFWQFPESTITPLISIGGLNAH